MLGAWERVRTEGTKSEIQTVIKWNFCVRFLFNLADPWCVRRVIYLVLKAQLRADDILRMNKPIVEASSFAVLYYWRWMRTKWSNE